MRLTVSRSGGVAGLTRRWQVIIDDLPDASDWIVLIGELPWSTSPEVSDGVDRFTYRFSLSGAEQLQPPNPEAVLAEQQVKGKWRELVDLAQKADSPAPREKAPADDAARGDGAADAAGPTRPTTDVAGDAPSSSGGDGDPATA